jgi:RNA recognition motif-containing protein
VKIFVGNLAESTTSEQILELFAGYGRVTSAEVIKDRRTGESKGFAFVEMPAKVQAWQAIRKLDLREINGRSMTVNEARPPRGGRRRRRY